MLDIPRDVCDRLDRAIVGWLTTVSPAGQPQTSAVWFLRDDDRFLVYSMTGTPRTRNIAANPRVAFNLDGDGKGGAVVTFEGDATIEADGPPPTDVPHYIAKYASLIASYGWTPESFARDYPVRLIIQARRLRTG